MNFIVQKDVIDHGKLTQNAALLEHHRNARLTGLYCIRELAFFPVKADLSCTRPNCAVGDLQQCRFACAVGPQKCVYASRRYPKVHPVQDLCLSEGLLDALQFHNEVRVAPLLVGPAPTVVVDPAHFTHF